MIEPAAAAMLAIGIDEAGDSSPADETRSIAIVDSDGVARGIAVIDGADVYIDWALVLQVVDQSDHQSFDYGLARMLIAVRDKTWKDMPK